MLAGAAGERRGRRGWPVSYRSSREPGRLACSAGVASRPGSAASVTGSLMWHAVPVGVRNPERVAGRVLEGDAPGP
jgi:hypothetical protein